MGSSHSNKDSLICQLTDSLTHSGLAWATTHAYAGLAARIPGAHVTTQTLNLTRRTTVQILARGAIQVAALDGARHLIKDSGGKSGGEKGGEAVRWRDVPSEVLEVVRETKERGGGGVLDIYADPPAILYAMRMQEG